MKKKMSRQDLKDLFMPYEPQSKKPEKATKKGFVHKHNPTWLPPKAEMSPAAWKRMMRERRLKHATNSNTQRTS